MVTTVAGACIGGGFREFNRVPDRPGKVRELLAGDPAPGLLAFSVVRIGPRAGKVLGRMSAFVRWRGKSFAGVAPTLALMDLFRVRDAR